MKAKFRGSENHPGNMTDSIADMIIRFKNAGASGKESLSVPYSKFKHEICNFLEKEGYIKSVSRRGKKIAKSLEVELLYENDKPKIREVKRVSKLSRRVYNKTKESMALWGTYVSHISNMIKGVNKQFVKKLVVEGIGFKVDLKGEKLVFALGFSHPVEVSVHQGISASVEKNVITISGVSKELVGEFTARLRDLKKPEPYKGKGVRYEEEVVKIKQGKKSV